MRCIPICECDSFVRAVRVYGDDFECDSFVSVVRVYEGYIHECYPILCVLGSCESIPIFMRDIPNYKY